MCIRDRKPFVFAGLWDIWQSADGSELPTCTVITTEPNELMHTIHDRMPVIFDDEKTIKRWLGPPDDYHPPIDVLKPCDPSKMTAYPVSKSVNSPTNDVCSLTDPVESESLFG